MSHHRYVRGRFAPQHLSNSEIRQTICVFSAAGKGKAAPGRHGTAAVSSERSRAAAVSNSFPETSQDSGVRRHLAAPPGEFT